MGFKSVEMQVAIPRTQDASKMQDQLTRQGQQFQEKLSQQQLREDIMKRTQVNEYEDVENKIVDDEDKEEQSHGEERKRKEEETEKEQANHPYLGKNIDFSR
ncbi:MAG TPA: hypothetical protein VK067_04090 [Pseudogracilibacillus sp.]|nr:hypothetical protein [Pseudogracilibacillus sp.]